MALEPYALVTLEEAKYELSITGTELDAQVERYIEDASLWCEHLCARRLKARAVSSTCAGHGQRILFADLFPIDTTQPIVITVDGVTQTVWKGAGDGHQADHDVIVRALVAGGEKDHFWRGATWGRGTASAPDNISLTYTGGIATVPELLKDACLLLVQKVSRDAVQQLSTEVSSISGVHGMAWRGNPVPLEAQRKLEAFMLVTMAPA